jgi:diacylglycerol kinase (ATP)
MKSPYKGKTGFKCLLNAFRQEVLLAAILLPLAFWVSSEVIGRALMISSVLLLLIVEFSKVSRKLVALQTAHSIAGSE